MVKISRYILVLIGILATAVAIPDLFWTIFRQGSSTPNIMYSNVLDDFIIVKSTDDGIVRMDTRGNIYTSDQVEELLPLMFFRQLSADGKMPDSLKGVALDHAIINRNRGSYSFMPRNINTPAPVMLPLLESKSGRVNLSLPEDMFRLKNRMEFIVASTNKIDKQKSKLFNDALIEKGFAFPARLIAGIPTTLKSKDEGYFVRDNRGDLFHLKMIQGKPFVARIDIPENMNIIHIECVDHRTSEFYAYLYTKEGEVYLLMDEIYYLQRLPIAKFDYTSEMLRVRYDVFGKTISVIGSNYIKVTRVDDIYEVSDYYEETWKPVYERDDHRMFARLFPFEIRMQVPDSRYVSFFMNFPKGHNWLLINVLFVAAAVVILRRKKRDLKKNAVDLAIILVSGIFGFVATQVFPNKFYD